MPVSTPCVLGQQSPCIMECAGHLHTRVGTDCICLGLHAGVHCGSFGTCESVHPGECLLRDNLRPDISA